MNGDYREASALVLMSTLAAAADVAHDMSERRRGRDPSSQEDPRVARGWILSALVEIEDYLLSLQAGRVVRDRDEARAALSRRMSEVLILNHLSRLLRVTHQRLLSLFPEVDAELIEDARLLLAESARLRDDDASSLEEFLRRAYQFCAAVRAAIGGRLRTS